MTYLVRMFAQKTALGRRARPAGGGQLAAGSLVASATVFSLLAAVPLLVVTIEPATGGQVPSRGIQLPPSVTPPGGLHAPVEHTAWLVSPAPGANALVAKPVEAMPFHYAGQVDERERAVDCLAAAGWYEAGDDPEGQRSVMQVVLNRLRHPSFPKSVCGVVFQGSERTTGCQFSFTCDGSMHRRFPSVSEWKRARELGRKALDGAVDPDVGQATHYHADYVSPWWSGALQRVTQVGVHIFYRWAGSQGHLTGVGRTGVEETALSEASWNGERPTPSSMQAPQPSSLAAAVPGAAQPVAVAELSPNVSHAKLLGVDPQAPNGRWAVAALDRCLGEKSCLVMAYAAGDEVSRNANLEPGQMQRPLFLFVRDPASGMDLSLWDCDRVARPDASQCLPADRSGLDRLMRNR